MIVRRSSFVVAVVWLVLSCKVVDEYLKSIGGNGMVGFRLLYVSTCRVSRVP
jgi:hypothetical protein